jgi:hypothetical protein
MKLDSFAGPVALLPPGKREQGDILEVLREFPLVSCFDLSELPWLRLGIASLERRGLIRDDRKEPYPWVRYVVESANGCDE